MEIKKALAIEPILNNYESLATTDCTSEPMFAYSAEPYNDVITSSSGWSSEFNTIMKNWKIGNYTWSPISAQSS